MAGIKPGAGTVTFAKDGKFTTLMGKYELSGTYEFDASTHVATLNFAKDKLDLGSVPGHAYIDGSNLLLVFPVTKLIDMVKAMGSKYRRWRPSSRCSKTTKTSISASNSAVKREKMRSRRKKLHFFSNDRFTTDLSFFITDFHPRSVPSRGQ
ncbi:MAG: lipocalin-like domain-containing protein [Alistipes finegoldii]